MCDLKDKIDVGLSDYDSNLDFKVYNKRKDASTMTINGFQYLWSGARASVGIHHGRYRFECTITEYNTPPVVNNCEPLDQTNACRIGWSTANATLQLGQDSYSFGYQNNGHRYTQGLSEPFGEPFSIGDIIGCYYDAENLTISYSKNGQFLGTAFSVPSEFRGQGLFPHVLLFNVVCHLNFGQDPVVGSRTEYNFIMYANIKDCTAGLMAPDSNKNCEVVMLVGLPCSGKTTWAKKMMKTDIMKNYTLIGYESIINQMHLERKDQSLKIPKEMLECIESIYWTLLGLAGTKERNYIIDDYNATPEGRKLVLKNFPGLMKKAVVFLPELSEIQKRYDNGTEKKISQQQFQHMLSYFSIPRKIGTTFSDIQYIDTKVPEDIVNEYRSALKTSHRCSSQNSNSFLSKSTELLPPPTTKTSFNPSYLPPPLIPSQSLSHSAPLASINLNNYSDYYSRRNIPYQRVPQYTTDNSTYLNQQHNHVSRVPFKGGMKLSRSDYYLSAKPSQYHYQPLAPYPPPQYVSLYPNQFPNFQ